MSKRFAMAMYDKSGQLVAGWGAGDGRVTTDFWQSTDEWANAVAVDGDGNFVVAGTAKIEGTPRIALAKYDNNGVLDAGFGAGGMVVDAVDQSSEDEAYDVAVDGKGRILVAGYSTMNDKRRFMLTRYLADGMIDSVFGPANDGRVMSFGFIANEEHAQAHGLAIDGQSQYITVAGEAEDLFSQKAFAAARYEDNGDPDLAFSANGRLATTFPGPDSGAAYAVIVPGPTVTVGGYITNLGKPHFAFARYDDSGLPDSSFSYDGVLMTPLTGTTESVVQRIIPAGKGAFYAVGYATVNNQDNFALACYTPDGNLDTEFAGDGWLVTGGFDGSTDAVARSGASRSFIGSSRLAAAGYAVVAGDMRFALAQYDPNGKLDPGFGNQGKVTTTFPGTTEAAASGVTYVTYQKSGANTNIVAVGWAGN